MCQQQGNKNKKALSGLALACLLPAARKTPARAHLHAPYTRHQKRPSLGPYLLHPWPSASLAFGAAGAPAMQAVIPPLLPVLTGADPRAPKKPQDQTPEGGPHADVGIKPKLNPRDGVTKEEDQKSFHQLYKLQIKSPQSAR